MVTVHNIGEFGGSILECVTDLRDVEVHGNRERFRRNMERVGFLLANELSKTLAYDKISIKTPLQETHGFRQRRQVKRADERNRQPREKPQGHQRLGERPDFPRVFARWRRHVAHVALIPRIP